MVGVDELVARGCHLREDPEPADGVLATELAPERLGNGAATDAVKAVAAGDEVALELAAGVPDRAAFRIDALDLGLEVQREPGREPRGDQILDDLRLAVDHDRAPAGQLVHRDMVALAVELQVDAAVDDPLAVEPRCNSQLAEEVDGALLEHARTDARLDVFAAAALEHDRLDARPFEQTRQRQPRRPCADDADLRPHGVSTGGVPYVWKLSIVLTPQAWPFARSACVQTTVGSSGS